MKFKKLMLLICFFSLVMIRPAAAAPPDIIHEMVVKISPQSDGSLNINYTLDYEATTDFPSDTQYLEVGVANSDFKLMEFSPSTLISKGYENKSGTSQVHLDFNRLPKKGDRFNINFSINQSSMMYNAGEENVSMQFRPGWFDFAVINELRVIVNTEEFPPAKFETQPHEINSKEAMWITKDMKANERADLITVIYPKGVFPDLVNVKSNSSSAGPIVIAVIVVAFFCFILIKFSIGSNYESGRYGGGYKGGSGIARRGPFNGGRGGGGCACACACACAGGGRVGCSERGYQVLNWLIKNKNYCRK